MSRLRNSYILHCAGERIRALFQRGVNVFFTSNLIPHLYALIEEDLVGFLDLFFGVFGDHVGSIWRWSSLGMPWQVRLSNKVGWQVSNLR